MTTELNVTVHPVADLFPMLPDDELKTLAADIKTRGLLHPIVLDTKNRIIDGRNRYAACQIAEIEPQFTTYDGSDPDGYALAVNALRRHMSKGQLAMVAARASINSILSQTKAAELFGVSKQYVTHAILVINYTSDGEAAVLSGAKILHDIYATAQESKKTEEKEADNQAAIRAEAPDLADDVADERITYADAIELLKERREDQRRATQVTEIDTLVTDDGGQPFAARVTEGELTWAEALTLAQQWSKEFDDAINRSTNRIQAVNDSWSAMLSYLTEPDTARNKAVRAALADIDLKRIEEFRNEITSRTTEIKKGARS